MQPQPVERWRDTRAATRFGATCAQAEELGVFAGPASVTEDCLFLNVFTTQLGRHGSSKGLPVFVWIHGGGDVDGESNDYDASKLAAGGPIGTPTVVVTMNYRLGLFGFFAHPAIDAEGHLFGNYAVLDQQAVACAAGLTPQQCYDLLGTHPGVCRDRVVDAMWAQYKDNPVYEYEFNDQGAPWYYPKMPDSTPTGLMTPLAAHTIDIQFLFPGWHGGALGVQGASQSPALSAYEETLSDELVAAWTYFAATGNPNPSGGNSPWPQFVDEPGTTCAVETGAGPVHYQCPDKKVPLFLSENVPALSTFTWSSFGAAHNCEFWDRVLVYQPPF